MGIIDVRGDLVFRSRVAIDNVGVGLIETAADVVVRDGRAHGIAAASRGRGKATRHRHQGVGLGSLYRDVASSRNAVRISNMSIECVSDGIDGQRATQTESPRARADANGNGHQRRVRTCQQMNRRRCALGVDARAVNVRLDRILDQVVTHCRANGHTLGGDCDAAGDRHEQ